MRKKRKISKKCQKTFSPFAKASIDVSNPKVSTNNSQNSPSKVNNNANFLIIMAFGNYLAFFRPFFDQKRKITTFIVIPFGKGCPAAGYGSW